MLQYGHVSGSWEFFEEVAAEAAPARWACFHVCVCVGGCGWDCGGEAALGLGFAGKGRHRHQSTQPCASFLSPLHHAQLHRGSRAAKMRCSASAALGATSGRAEFGSLSFFPPMAITSS